jgi:tetratricopeptide (TPR) repeat protein
MVSAAEGDTAVRDSSTLEIARHVWFNRFDKALTGADRLIESEPDNPLGYFLKGTIYQTISEEFRNDKFADEIDDLLSQAIKMADYRRKDDRGNPDWYFICGASYGYRALLRAFHGGWFSAFKDGLKCGSNLEKALEYDSTICDAWLGLGAYHYYKTIKAKDFLWLPFVSDRREQGIEEITRAARNGFLASYNARESLLRIFYTEGRYEDALNLADSLDAVNPDDPYCLLYHAQGLIKVDSLDLAALKLRKLKNAWRKSPYYDALGQYEAELVTARLFIAEGDTESARKVLERIIEGKSMRDANAYFAETYDKAKKLKKLCR